MSLLALIKRNSRHSENIQARHHPQRDGASGNLDDITAFAASLGCTDIQVFPSSITGGDGNVEFFIGARRG
jgi:23S rRNA (cytidine1920-2'-O)/16S rRNA (cytidine1409-2'-O)-methyltransferase